VIIATHSPHIIGSAKSESLRILKKVDGKIEAFKYSQSYGFEFSKILTDIMDVEYLRTPEVSKQLAKVKAMIVANEFDSESFQNEWRELESLLGEKNLDLKLLKLEIASRKKNV
jgi:predicted ATP-binding protein involved in virulence